jgi:sporulation protein YlmC with PRC-barrel domain
MRVVYEEALSGRSVIDSTGRAIGEIVGLIIDAESWHIEALRVKLNRNVMEEIDAPHATFRAARLDIPTQFVESVSDAVMLRGPIGSLHTLEEQPSP